MIRTLVQRFELAHAQRRHGVSRAEDRVPVGMRAPQRFVVQLEHEIVGCVLHHPDLPEYYLSLEQQIFPAQQRTEDQIADDIRRIHEVLDPAQRAKIADWLSHNSGFFGGGEGGPYRSVSL